VGHIDLYGQFSYIEVPQNDARKVMRALNGKTYHGRQIRCNEADREPNKAPEKPARSKKQAQRRANDDWRRLMMDNPVKLKGSAPDFTEEGWARRRPKKKK